MARHPAVLTEDGLTAIQWLQKKMTVLDPAEWGGDLELCLLALGIQRDIVVITNICYARKISLSTTASSKNEGGNLYPSDKLRVLCP